MDRVGALQRQVVEGEQRQKQVGGEPGEGEQEAEEGDIRWD